MGTVQTKVQITGDTSSFNKACASVNKQADKMKKSLQGAAQKGVGSLTSGLSNIQSMAGNAAQGVTSIGSSLMSLGPMGAAAGAAIAAIGAGISSSQTLTDMFAKKWEQLKGILATVASAMGALLQGNFSEAWDILKGAGDAAEAAGEYADALDNLGTREIEWSARSKDLQSQMAKEKQIITDTTTSVKDREAAQQRLDALTKEYEKSAQAYIDAAQKTYDTYLEKLIAQSGLAGKFTKEEKERIKQFARGAEDGIRGMTRLGGKWASLADKISDENQSQLNEYADKISELQQKIADVTRSNQKQVVKELEKPLKVKADAEGVDIGLVERINKALTDAEASPDALRNFIDELTEKMMTAGTQAAQEYYLSLYNELERQAQQRQADLDTFSEWENAINAETDAIAAEVAQSDELLRKTQEIIDAKNKMYEQDQKGMEATSAILGSASDALGNFAQESEAAARAQKLLALAEQAAALAAAIHSAAKGDPYTVAPRIAAAAAAVVAAFASMAKFANGGIVGGNSHNDGITARLSSGEMVLNHTQQGNLFRLLNRGGGASGPQVVYMKASGRELNATIGNYKTSLNRLQ